MISNFTILNPEFSTVVFQYFVISPLTSLLLQTVAFSADIYLIFVITLQLSVNRLGCI